jgi:hypothetical protein
VAFLDQIGMKSSGYMVALMAMMESQSMARQVRRQQPSLLKKKRLSAL